jgi:hypothetical protein
MTAAIRLLNQMPVKEGIKNVIGIATFLGCAVEIYKFCAKPETPAQSTAMKVIVRCTQLSIILAFLTSRPMLRFFPQGPIFAINPWQARHLMSVSASLLALPAVIHSMFKLWKEMSSLETMANFHFWTGRPFLNRANYFLSCLRVR